LYLKRLELYGFKTFADRTDLEFGSGITAIVGPNGSGKSNLSDAIMWCLGEQSMKSLRSARAEDIIFTGSETRRRAGVGEVTITLDNSDGALPLDFSEVTITRRVFRTGEGEYFINRVPCRLRDIHELLLDTGIGKHAYSLISQNEVDRLLSVRSEDRREIFEQAAGIQRYRQRKNEALRKLDKVRENLIRVNDIIHELEVQVEPLAQQSEAAREYRRFSKELFDLKLGLLVEEHRALSENLARSREREVELEKEIESSRTRLHQLAAEEVEVRVKLQECEERLEAARGLAARLGSEAERSEGRLNLTVQKIEDLRAQAETAARDLERLQQQVAAAAEELAAAERQQPELEAKVQELRAEVAAREAVLREQIGSVRLAGTSAEEQRGEHLETLRDLADARNRLVQCESFIQAAEARVARLKEQRAGLTGLRGAAERHAAEAAKTAQQRRGERDRLQAELYALRSQEEAERAEIEQLGQEELRLRERLSEARARHRTLQEMERSREGLRAGVRAVLQAVDRGELRGEYRTVADLLRVPKELEPAMESALGASAGDLVTPTQGEAAAAIEYLKRAKAGRATFLPKSDIRPATRPAHLAQLARRPGCVGVAADLITCAAGVEPIIEHLLGRVLVMETLEAALALAKSTQGWRELVTLDGDVVRPWGAITGGSPAPSSHLLGRAREIEELEAEQAKLNESLAQLATRSGEASARAESARASGNERARQLEQVGASLAEAERQAEVAAAEARREAERDEGLRGEQEALEREIGENQTERGAAAQRVQELEDRQHAAETAMAEMEAALKEGQETREKLSDVMGELRVQVTAAEGELRALVERTAKSRQSLQALETSVADKRALREQLEESRQQAEQSLEAVRTEGQRLREQHAQAEQEAERNRVQRQQFLDLLAANREADGQLREEVERAQERLHRSQLRTTQLDSELNFTERTLADEYRITLEEAERRAQPIESRTAAKEQVKTLQAQIDALGEVNLGAVEEYERVTERLEFLGTQRTDLEKARGDVEQTILQIDREATSRFLSAFDQLNEEFQRFFVRLFNGGHAELVLSDAENVLESGVDVSVTVPGKKTRDLLQLSGGERALTASAILFAMLKVKPSPFVILDEVDAPLDDSNVGRYGDLLREFAQESQFVIITHNKGTMEAADTLYGVTMAEAGVSRLLGVKLRDDAPAGTNGGAGATVEELVEEVPAE
jgi:chromosome segregation protein